MRTWNSTFVRTLIRGTAGLAVVAMPAIGFSQDNESDQPDQGRRRGRIQLRDSDRPQEGRRDRGGPRREGFGGRGMGERGFGGRPDGGPGMLMRLPVLAALDADKDGLISAEEIEGAVAALKTLDKNKDGKLVIQELLPERGGPGAGRPDGDRPRPDGDRPGDRPEGDRLSREGGRGPGGFRDPEAMLERLMQRDKDADGLLSTEELPQMMAQMLTRADKNGDQKLSREEIKNAMETMRRSRGDRAGARGNRGESDTPGGERPRRPPTE